MFVIVRVVLVSTFFVLVGPVVWGIFCFVWGGNTFTFPWGDGGLQYCQRPSSGAERPARAPPHPCAPTFTIAAAVCPPRSVDGAVSAACQDLVYSLTIINYLII